MARIDEEKSLYELLKVEGVGGVLPFPSPIPALKGPSMLKVTMNNPDCLTADYLFCGLKAAIVTFVLIDGEVITTVDPIEYPKGVPA